MATDLERLLEMLASDTSGVPQLRRDPAEPAPLEISGFARETPLRMPVSRGGRFLDNFAASIAEVPPPQARRGAGAGEQFLAGLLGGTAQGFARGRLTDAAERELFNRSQAAQSEARVKERDASFKTARTKAEAVKKDRIAQMRRAIERYEKEADSADNNARNAFDEGSRTSFAAKRDRALGEVARIEKDLARLEGRSAEARPAPAAITAKAKVATPRAAGPASSGPFNSGAASLTPGAARMAAQYLLDTGEMLPLGMGGAARVAVLNEADVLAKERGITTPLSTSKAGFASNRATQTRLQGMVDAVEAFENTALANSEVLLDAMRKIPDTGIPALNAPLRAMQGRIMGSAEQAAYDVAQRVVVPEFAKILSNPNLTGVLTDEARKEIERVIRGDATLNQMQAIIRTLKVDAENRRKFYRQQLGEIRGRIGARGEGEAQSFQWKPSSLSGGQ